MLTAGLVGLRVTRLRLMAMYSQGTDDKARTRQRRHRWLIPLPTG